MREVQKEAHVIETEMEQRFQYMLAQNEAKMMNLPNSLTQDHDKVQAQKETLQGQVDKLSGFDKTREVILQKLGGPFDYGVFMEEVRQMKTEREQMKRLFKTQQLFPPDLSNSDFGGKKAFYDFSSRPLTMGEGPAEAATSMEATRVTNEKPDHLKNLVTEPPKFFINEEFHAPVSQPKPQAQTQPVQQHAQNLAPASSHHSFAQQSQGDSNRVQMTAGPFQSQPQQQESFRPTQPEQPKIDILSLKKQVLEEVRQELERERLEKEEEAARKERLQKAEQQRKEQFGHGEIFPASEMKTQIIGEKTPAQVENDHQQDILKTLRTAQADSHKNINDFVRQSINSLAATERQSLNESMLVDALTHYMVNGGQQPQNQSTTSIQSSEVRRVGEEMIIEKLNKIFDEVKGDNKEFEESYANTSGGHGQTNNNQGKIV